jgi:pimeloyl-ACP methyl ester carboxylesterase
MANERIGLLLAACFLAAACGRGGGIGERRVDVGGHRLFMRDAGKGRPAVVIDAGIGDGCDKVRPLQERLARATRVIAYDRAGYGRSEPGPLPRDAGREADELRALLERAGVPAPFVVVGHSLGGLNAQLFAARFPTAVAGLVLLDPPPLSFLLGRDYRELAALAARMTGEWQAAAAAARSAGEPEKRAQAAFLYAIASEHREMFAASAQDAAAIPGFGDLPLAVMAAGRVNPAFGPAAGDYQRYWIEQNRLLAAKSRQGRFVLLPDSSHYLYLDAPGAVEEAVLSMVRRARAGGVAGRERME